MRATRLYPYLFAVFPILSLWAANVQEARLRDVAIALAAAAVLAWVATVVARAVAIGSDRAAALGSLWTLLFLSYSHIARVAGSIHAGSLDLSRGPAVSAITGALAVGGALVLRTRKDIDRPLARTLTIVAATLVASTALEIGASWRGIAGNAVGVVPRVEARTRGPVESHDAGRPDVYYIVMDGYASLETLRDVYGFDNSVFYGYLRRAGFRIAGASRSNYPMTLLSLASSLNMEYLEPLHIDAPSRHHAFVEMIRDSRVLRMFREHGYRTVHFSSGWDATETNPVADVNVPCGRLSDFSTMLIRSTFVRPIDHYLTAYVHPRRVSCEIDELAAARDPDRPSFVFAHIVAPHPPFVFGRNGEWLPDPGVIDSSVNAWGDRDRYVDEIRALNTKLRIAIDAIVRDANRPVVIIVQGDHGPASLAEWNHPSDTFLRERLTILNAYLVPEAVRTAIYPSMTPVNSFRALLSALFGADLPMVEDRTYFSTYDDPFALVDVTDRFGRARAPAYHSVSDRPAR